MTKKSISTVTADATKWTIVEIAEGFAKSTDTARDYAAEMLRRYPNAALPEETWSALKTAWMTRKRGMVPAEWYEKVGADQYYRVQEAPPEEAENFLHLTADFCCSFSSTDFGKLKGEQPNLHALIKGVRDNVSMYAASKKQAFESMLKKMLREEQAHGANAKRAFIVALEAYLLDRKKSLANARKQGQTGLCEDSVYEKAVAEFLAKVHNG